MPRYFFHVMDGRDFPDLRGTELAGLDEARREAMRFAGDVLARESDMFRQAPTWAMRVSDDRGSTLFELRISLTGGAAGADAAAGVTRV